MEVLRAKSAGFCWGVERAIDIASKFASEGKRPVYTDGPLIHNKQMMERLEATGIQEVGDYQSATEVVVSDEDRENGVLVVRAHGISPERRQYLKNLGMDFKDATCPDVGIIAGKIKMHSRKGYSTVIFGDPKHPEVMGLMGYTADNGHVVKNEEDIRNLPELGDKVCMVSQSTMFTDEFWRLSEILKERFPEAIVFDTICGATKERQSDIHVLKDGGAEAIVVVGGRHSANTRKLAALVEKEKLPAYHVETAAELDFEHIKSRYTKVGVTAGASTPEFVIQEIVEKLKAI
ncbi:4-hydroxy-3-methylbut-2-enyl diphosphate reductase [Rubellicoccus peritrichatus]|uniref:4-hydroxy-3-methylbut-2-enyl diphosphate reductase n=1 Tax=Rubellicoccus peritrichatus TaxID=3080537 RepID=A0AAQ3LD20_9BACT|nr:4-hydroxy-3-methylbut-2-enyl diphosphate reductase [Puniceicoccus sp. CR14]WOO41323.1 4-hydroxy-3-methylbut-2-enyl diphosphate reductase [Puniceicoccus sp. CR14]